ncbi:MAG: hypothetical protein KC505_04680 [Myxococcales bacterium]|nr:hypothetical protein [Myxococcales bacterium]
MIKNKLLRFYLICLTAAGVLIHFFGALKLFQLDVPQANHLIMLIVDSLVVFGLLKRSTWGYWLAILLYIQQSFMQPYCAYQNYLFTGAVYQLILTSPLVIIALVILAVNKQLFVQRGN